MGNSEMCKIGNGYPEWIRVCRDTKLSDRPVLATIDSAKDVWNILEKRARTEEQEVFYVISLDSQMNVLGVSEIARGTANNLGVHIRDIFRVAIILGSVYLIAAHNHPSGILEPSESDVELTKQLIIAGNLLGIKIVDNLIVTSKGYYSFADTGLIDAQEFYGDDE